VGEMGNAPARYRVSVIRLQAALEIKSPSATATTQRQSSPWIARPQSFLLALSGWVDGHFFE
jgi:hypothetical protein